MRLIKTILLLFAGTLLGISISEHMHVPCKPKVVFSETPMCYNSGITTAAIKLTYGECKEICKRRHQMEEVLKGAKK